MSEKPKDGAGQKPQREARQARLAAELRANLLKRKAKAKSKAPPRDRNEGRQG
jgi:hypothetical protein